MASAKKGEALIAGCSPAVSLATFGYPQQIAAMVISSRVNEDGDQIYPRNWKKMGLIIPKLIKKKQRRPCYTFEVMNHLANSLGIKPKMRMRFILCGASGLRIGEALGIRIEKILRPSRHFFNLGKVQTKS
jgi:hypothetical protein